VQTAWIRLVEHADAIQDPQAVLGWLVTTVRREAWRVLRQSGRAVPTDDLPEESAGAPSAPSVDAARSTRRSSPSCTRANSSSGTTSRPLPQRCQAFLRVIAFVDRPDYAALSEALGMPVGSIGPTRGRCLAKLRAALLADPTWSPS
jgi:DNA-directed RNA polymerase specialized sigma24 family protein